MNDKIQERLPQSSEIINSLKGTIDSIHSACGESNANLFRLELAKLVAKWAVRLSENSKGD